MRTPLTKFMSLLILNLEHITLDRISPNDVEPCLLLLCLPLLAPRTEVFPTLICIRSDTDGSQACLGHMVVVDLEIFDSLVEVVSWRSDKLYRIQNLTTGF